MLGFIDVCLFDVFLNDIISDVRKVCIFGNLIYIGLDPLVGVSGGCCFVMIGHCEYTKVKKSTVHLFVHSIEKEPKHCLRGWLF